MPANSYAKLEEHEEATPQKRTSRRARLFKLIQDARKKTSKEFRNSVQRVTTWKDWFFEWGSGILPPLSAWILWMVIGTLFYSLEEYHGSICKGFYFSICTGYSIGWGVLHEHSNASKIFSIAYLLVGAIFVSRWLTYLIEKALKDSNDAYEQYQMKQNMYRSLKYRGIWADLYVFFTMNNSKLFTIYMWLVFIFVGIFLGIGAVGWDFIDALYFSITSMSTAGLKGIPADSPDWLFLLVGLFAAAGVPLMGMAIANIAHFIYSARQWKELVKVRSLEISPEEHDLMQLLHPTHRNALNRSEYIILRLAQQGLLDWSDLSAFLTQFDQLNEADTGVVTYSIKHDSVLNPLRRSSPIAKKYEVSVEDHLPNGMPVRELCFEEEPTSQLPA